MNKYDWKNAFPKPSENFHNKLCMTLDSFEKENVKMKKVSFKTVSYTHLRAHETGRNLVCRLLLEKKKNKQEQTN